jgi:CPA2 family monovalent cation:H+ antiporter-2
VNVLACVLTLAACSPFLYAIVLKAPGKIPSNESETLLRLSRLQLGIVALRAILGLILIEIIIGQFSTTRLLPLVVLLGSPVLIYLLRNRVARLYMRVEGRFLQNLNAKAQAELESLARMPQLAPWNATLAQVRVPADSSWVGKTLAESHFRTSTGATVAMIDRGRRRIFAPNRDERLFPNDELFLIGTEEQIAVAHKRLEPDPSLSPPAHDEMFALDSFQIQNGSRYADRSIRDSGVGQEFGGLVVGIERAGTRLLNPESSEILRPDDQVWVFGHKEQIRQLKQTNLRSPA